MTEIVQTVLGSISPQKLGRTLPHEHLAMDFSHFYSAPPILLADKFHSGFSLDRVGYLRQYPYSSAFNLLLNDGGAAAAVMNDVREYKRCGGGMWNKLQRYCKLKCSSIEGEGLVICHTGLFLVRTPVSHKGTIVENSTEGLKRNVGFCKEVSTETGVHIVVGTGYYIADMQAEASLCSSTEDYYNHMRSELSEGCVGEGAVKAGFMGELASVWPLRDFEKKVIKAAGELQPQVGCGVSFHPHRDSEAPFEIVRLYLEAGGAADKCVMSHLDRTLLKDEDLLEFSKLGVYCQFDLFGVEVSLYQLNMSTDMPSDAQRLDKIRLLVNEGREDRVLMSHDIHTKHRLIDYGGHGYSHILNNVLPKMQVKGFSTEVIDKITIENPARWLSKPE